MIENHVFNKKFGQNFISDKNLLAAIVKDANISQNDEVLEIGAGAGALTEELAKSAKKVVSYEIDKTLTEHLKEIEEKHENLTIKMEDALKTKIAELEKDFFFYTWCPYDEGRSVIRLVTNWGSTQEDIDAIIAAIQK